MSTHVYTRVLGRASSVVAGSTDLGAPDVGTQWVVRDIVIAHQAAEPAFVQVYYTLPDGSVIVLLVLEALAPNTSAHTDLRQVINAGEVLSAYCFSQPYQVAVTGYVFAV